MHTNQTEITFESQGDLLTSDVVDVGPTAPRIIVFHSLSTCDVHGCT